MLATAALFVLTRFGSFCGSAVVTYHPDWRNDAAVRLNFPDTAGLITPGVDSPGAAHVSGGASPALSAGGREAQHGHAVAAGNSSAGKGGRARARKLLTHSPMAGSPVFGGSSEMTPVHSPGGSVPNAFQRWAPEVKTEAGAHSEEASVGTQCRFGDVGSKRGRDRDLDGGLELLSHLCGVVMDTPHRVNSSRADVDVQVSPRPAPPPQPHLH